MKGYPKWFTTFLVGLLSVLLLTGILLTPTTLEFRLGWNVIWRLEGGERLSITALHTALSFLLLMTFGALWPVHIRAGVRMKANLVSGITTTVAIVILALTGLGILYLGDENFSILSAVGHLIMGYLLIGIFGFHFILGRRRHRERLQLQHSRLR